MTFEIVIHYQGFAASVDAQIEEQLGKQADASGFDLTSQTRDMIFTIDGSQRSVQAKVRRLKSRFPQVKVAASPQ